MPVTTLRSLLLASLSVVALSACGTNDNINADKSAVPMPPESGSATATPPAQPLPLSQSDTLTPVLPMAATTVAPTEAATPAAAPASSAMEARMAKLEAAVGSLRSDYDRIMPAFASLNTTNERIQTLLDEMEAGGQVPPAAAAARVAPATEGVAAAPVVAAPAQPAKIQPSEEDMAAATAPAARAEEQPATMAPPAPDSSSSNTVTAVRIGEHGAKTRLVFDLTAKTKPDFKYDLDNAEKVLLVDMPGSAWTAKTTGKPNSPLIAGWNVQKGTSGGSTVAVQMKKDARIVSTEFLKAEGSTPARLVMDIASGG